MATEMIPRRGQEEEEQSGEKLSPYEKGKDSSLDLVYGLLFDLKESFGRVDERTKNIERTTEEIKGNVKNIEGNVQTVRDQQRDFVTEKFAWKITALLVSVIGIIAALLAGVVYNHTHSNEQLRRTPPPETSQTP